MLDSKRKKPVRGASLLVFETDFQYMMDGAVSYRHSCHWAHFNLCWSYTHVLVRHKSTSARVSCVTVASISVYTSLRVYESLRQYTKVLSVRGEKAQG